MIFCLKVINWHPLNYNILKLLNLHKFSFILQVETLGIVASIENNHKAVPTARKGLEVCVKIEPVPGETPKMFGRHFDENDMLLSKVSIITDYLHRVIQAHMKKSIPYVLNLSMHLGY